MIKLEQRLRDFSLSESSRQNIINGSNETPAEFETIAQTALAGHFCVKGKEGNFSRFSSSSEANMLATSLWFSLFCIVRPRRKVSFMMSYSSQSILMVAVTSFFAPNVSDIFCFFLLVNHLGVSVSSCCTAVVPLRPSFLLLG